MGKNITSKERVRTALGMEAEGLKRDFGDRLSFNGGIDTQGLLPHATADVPAENVPAVYETALGTRFVREE